MKDEFIKVCKEAGTKPKALGDVLGGIAIVIGETTNAEKFKTEIEGGDYIYKIEYSFIRYKKGG